jgi:hypothetical protein
MTQDDSDRAQDDLTQRLIGFLSGARVLSHAGDEEAEDAFLAAVGNFAMELTPNFTVTGQMTNDELSSRISQEVLAHTTRLLSAVAFVFGELAEVNDSALEMSSAEVLQTLAANIANRSGEE